ncbi:hypothetical protein DYQ86_08345 [Acidobacteria bacterium AB60]|nr:hypothetical protein DYQ86_08345 [Acidobacteria bacterium AB60]
MPDLNAPYNLTDLTRFAQTALKIAGAVIYVSDGVYKLTSPRTASPVSLGRSLHEAARTLQAEQRRLQQDCAHLFSIRVTPETPDGKRFRCPDCGKETRNVLGVILTHPVAPSAHA